MRAKSGRDHYGKGMADPWLITWEGNEVEDGRCKIVAILDGSLGSATATSLMPLFYWRDQGNSMEEKIYKAPKTKDQFLCKTHRHINEEFCYGQMPHYYLKARRVDNFRFLEGGNTARWIERAKYESAPTSEEKVKEVLGPRKIEYTWSSPSRDSSLSR
jgi:hypothetical protein